MKKSTIAVLLVVLVLIVAVPMITLGRSAEFGGADGQAEELITEMNPDYEPWFTPLMERIFPEGLPGELESLILLPAGSLRFRCHLLQYRLYGGTFKI